MRSISPLFASLMILGAGCHAEPSTTPPEASARSSPTATGSPDGRRAAPTRTCEPAAYCGVWGECQSYERISDAPIERWRAETGPSKGTSFTRRHHCFPKDAGKSGCQVYCAGKGTEERCVDALAAEDEICTAHAPPQPAPFSCEMRGAACVRVER